MPLVELDELFEVDDPVLELVPPLVELLVPLVPEFVVVAAAVWETPEMSPTVSAPAAAAATVPATAALLRRGFPSMSTTVAGTGSRRPHRSVKPFSRLIRGRVGAT
jgi:hypothetical protein